MALRPFAETGSISRAGLWAMLGAAESLSKAAATGEITPAEEKAELFQMIVSMVGRNSSP